MIKLLGQLTSLPPATIAHAANLSICTGGIALASYGLHTGLHRLPSSKAGGVIELHFNSWYWLSCAIGIGLSLSHLAGARLPTNWLDRLDLASYGALAIGAGLRFHHELAAYESGSDCEKQRAIVGMVSCIMESLGAVAILAFGHSYHTTTLALLILTLRSGGIIGVWLESPRL